MGIEVYNRMAFVSQLIKSLPYIKEQSPLQTNFPGYREDPFSIEDHHLFSARRFIFFINGSCPSVFKASDCLDASHEEFFIDGEVFPTVRSNHPCLGTKVEGCIYRE